MRLIEQTIGWNGFSILLVCFGLWGAFYSLVSFWKAVVSTPDVTALNDHLEFHPAVKLAPVEYEEISHWSIEFVSGHPVLWIHLFEPYWSLQGLFKRKTIKLEGGK